MYAHLFPKSAKVKVGDKVESGQELASVGTTGNSTGNHLHFQVMQNGINVDGMSLIDFLNEKTDNNLEFQKPQLTPNIKYTEK